MGTLVGHANPPLTAEFCVTAMIKNTLSLSWRIGRAVMLANQEARIGQIGEIVVDAAGGHSGGKVIFVGKIVDVSRRVHKGHTIGEVIIAPLPADNGDDPGYQGLLKSELARLKTRLSLSRSTVQERKSTRRTLQGIGVHSDLHRSRLDLCA